MRRIGACAGWWMLAGLVTIGAGAAHADVVPLPGATLANGGFEANELAPWEAYGPTAEVTTDTPASGAKSLRLGIAATTTTAEAGAYQDVQGQGGAAAVHLAAAIAVDQALTGDTIVELKLESHVNGGTASSYVALTTHVAPTAPGTYTTLRTCLDVASLDANLLRPVVVVRSPAGGGAGAVRVDDVTLTTELGAACDPDDTVASGDDGCGAGGAGGALALATALGLLAARRRSSRG